jgi:hypothetical protein
MEGNAESNLPHHPALPVALMLVLIVLMLRPSFTSGFYALDDTMYVYLADRMSIPELFSVKTGAVPITLLSLKLDRAIFGPSIKTPRPAVETGQLGTIGPPPEIEKAYREGIFAPATRVMNAIYHLLAGILLWLFLKRIRVSAGVAMIVALAWVGHPTACESVCWISERKNVMVALFSFATLYAWSADRQCRWRWPAVYALYALALASKPSAVGIFPVLAALEVLDPIERKFNFRSAKCWVIAGLHLTIPALLCFADAALYVTGWKAAVITPPGGSRFNAVLTDCEVFGRYALNALAPVKLSFFYCIVPVFSMADSRVWLYGFPLLLGFTACIVASRRTERHFAILGAIWFFAALGPNANIISTYAWMHDRFEYLSLPGIILAASCGAAGILERFQAPARYLHYAATGWIAFLAICLGIRASSFSDIDTLELDAVKQEPLSAEAQLRAGYVYRRLALDSAPGGSKPDLQLLKPAARLSCVHFQNAIDAPDHRYLVNPFLVKLHSAEVLLQAGDYQAAGSALEGWLPPPNMRVNDGEIPGDEFGTCYSTQMLAHGWALKAEARMRESLAPALPATDRERLLNEALKLVANSIEVSNVQYEGSIVRSKILFQISMLESEEHKDTLAKEHYEAAISLLNSVPEACPNRKVAKYLLENAKPPK